MKYRKLRIAWSAICGFVCLLLIVLWVRSYWCVDVAFFKVTDYVYVFAESAQGAFGFNIYSEEYVPPGMYHQPTEEWLRTHGQRERLGPRVFWAADKGIVAAYWFWLLIPATLAAASWLPWRNRFSLRTLLIGMTVVAAILGAVIHAAN